MMLVSVRRACSTRLRPAAAAMPVRGFKQKKKEDGAANSSERVAQTQAVVREYLKVQDLMRKAIDHQEGRRPEVPAEELARRKEVVDAYARGRKAEMARIKTRLNLLFASAHRAVLALPPELQEEARRPDRRTPEALPRLWTDTPPTRDFVE